MNKRNSPRNKIKIKAPSESQVIQLKLKSHIYLNRELSWLHFNRRVLGQVADESNPVLERLRFCNIFISNLNEFCMKRIGGLKNQIESVYSFQSIDGKNPKEQLKLIREDIQ